MTFFRRYAPSLGKSSPQLGQFFAGGAIVFA